MIKAMPEVKPVITDEGMKATKRPMRSRPMTRMMMPARRPVIQMPSIPTRWAMTMSTALIAPVGPEIWYGAPERAPMMKPLRMAVTRPAAARGAGGHTKGEGQGQRHGGNRQAGKKVLAELARGIMAELAPPEREQGQSLHSYFA